MKIQNGHEFHRHQILFDAPPLLLIFAGVILFLVFLEWTWRGTTPVPERSKQVVSMHTPNQTVPDAQIGLSNAPWVSRLFTQLDIIQGYTPANPPEDPKDLRAFSARAMLGKRPDRLPCLDKTRSMSSPPKPIRDISLANGQLLLVSDRMKRLLQAANGGTCAFYPTEIYDARERRLLSSEYSYWSIGARKQSLQVDLTPGLRAVTKNETSSAFGTFHTPHIITDRQICLSGECLNGPQIWVEGKLRGAMFFSDAFVQTLKQNKLDRLFGLKRCNIRS